MKLHKLMVHNFRGFKDLTIELDPNVTVIVGVNGAGKTSLLDAIALMLTHLTSGVKAGRPEGLELSTNDVRSDASTTTIELTAEIEGVNVTWKIVKTLTGHPVEVSHDLAALQLPIHSAQASIESGAPSIPLAVYFPTNRNVLDISSRILKPHEFDVLSAYDGALASGTCTFRGFFEWFRQEEDLYNEGLRRTSELPCQISHLPIVQSAIEGIFPGVKELRIERRLNRMTLLLNKSRLDVVQLSDGEKLLLAMAGDLARRMTLAAPTLENPLNHPAVVLIDELELHLHPGLQHTIISRLREVFMHTQFVVSTHSPHVMSSVRSENVFVV